MLTLAGPSLLFIYFFLALPQGMQDLCSQTRN